jgi:phospholipase C
MAPSAKNSAKRIVVFIQENKTTDFYFPTLSAWGADVTNSGQLLHNAPDFDQPHDRNSWVHYKMGDYPAAALQIDNDVVIPFYSWLAKQFTFCDHHFGLGTNSTPGHMLAIGGQTPTLRNPPSTQTEPVWDLPTIFKHVERAGLTWAAFPDENDYPVKYYTELRDAASKRNIHGSTKSADKFIELAGKGTLPQLCYVWSPGGYDEHPPRKPDPQYAQRGHNLIWQRVEAVVKAGGWNDTVFILTWDDWGGYADHVPTPDAETVPDALHPGGFQAIGGSRIPLIMFGGTVKQGIESEWHSHASLSKTVIDLFGLDKFGVPRVDQAPSLAGRVDGTLQRPKPPGFGTTIVQPPPPHPTPSPVPPKPWGGPHSKALPDLIGNGGTIPAPRDGLVRAKPPQLPSEAE